MAKSKGGKSKAAERRAQLAQLEAERRRAERRRRWTFVGIVGLVALLIVGLTGWQLLKEKRQSDEFAALNLTEFGVPAADAQCDARIEKHAQGSGQHVPSGPITYQDDPPSFGPHRPTWVRFAREFYTPEDRPEVPLLVHNLEHGYLVLWYDETVADDPDARAELEGLAAKFSGDDQNPKNAFIAAPWTSEDGGPFPDGKHYALTHWYANPETGQDQKGITEYCGKLSGEVVKSFMEDYPQSDTPEPGAANL